MSAIANKLRGGKCSESTLHIHPTEAGKTRLQEYAASRRWPAAVAAAVLLECLLARMQGYPAPAGGVPQGAGGHGGTRVSRPDVEIRFRLTAEEFEDLRELAALDSHTPEFVAAQVVRAGVAGKLVEKNLAVAVRYSRRPHGTGHFLWEA